MLEALAAALLLGSLNTIADFVTAELRLQTKPIYMLGRIVLICYCVGGIVGARARQLLMGTLGGFMVGAFAAGAYFALLPTLGWNAAVVAWAVFWIGFSLLDAVLSGGTFTGSLLQGLIAATISGAAFFAITNIWSEPESRDPNLFRGLASWTVSFFPGFVVLFWRRL